MDMPGTALSLSAAILGALQGQIGSILHKWLDYKYKIKSLKADTYLKDKNSAREASNPRFLITRSFLAIATGFYIFIFPALASYLEIPIFCAYSESNGSILSFFYGDYTVHWQKIDGFAMTPLQAYLSSLVWTLYFGMKNE